MRSRCMSSIAAMFLLSWARRMKADYRSPSRIANIASSSVARAIEAVIALAIVIEYSWAFADYFEAARALVTGSSMGKYNGLLDANFDGNLLSKPSAITSRYMLWET